MNRLIIPVGLVGVSFIGEVTSYRIPILWEMFIIWNASTIVGLIAALVGYQTHLPHAKLLRSLLSFHQRVTWWALGWIAVRGSLGRWYLIHPDTIMNVHRGWRRYCIQPRGVDSVEGTVLAQYLVLKTDEGKFRATAVKGTGLFPW